jgi:hypothetical protein
MEIAPDTARGHEAAPLAALALPVGQAPHTSAVLAAPPTARKVPAPHAWHNPLASLNMPGPQ